MNEVELSSFICDASALQMWEQRNYMVPWQLATRRPVAPAA
ncbi:MULTISPECIES: hypothetical protein [unclassified Planococcus (in: firmicutes)]|nr:MULTISPECIES: hypothetical protein [unclassified Planococcus (in: firmicutes)]